MRLGGSAAEEATVLKHIFIATDGSRLAEMAAGHGLELAKQLNAKVTAVTVTGPWSEAYASVAPPSWAQAYERAAVENATAVVASVCGIAERMQIPCATHHVRDQHAAEASSRRRSGINAT